MSLTTHHLKFTPLLLGICWSQLVQPAVAEDATVNRLLASQCAQCHGTDGYAVGDFEDIAGEDPKDMREDLGDMKREDKAENIMDHQALGYSDDQIRRIASYYASLAENRSESDKSETGEQELKEPEEPEEHEEDEEDEHSDEQEDR